MNNKDKKYYVVKSLMMANALTFVTGQMPYTFVNIHEPGKRVWSFINNDRFKEAITKLTDLKNELHI